MGGLVSSALDANMKKQQEFMLETQKMQMERQLEMQNLMRERMMAMQIGRTQELLVNWMIPFSILVTGGAMYTAYKTKQKDRRLFLPLVPLYSVCAYQAHLVFGDKMELIRRNADRYLADYPEMFMLPQGPITMDEIEVRRTETKDNERFKPHQAFL